MSTHTGPIKWLQPFLAVRMAMASHSHFKCHRSKLHTISKMSIMSTEYRMLRNLLRYYLSLCCLANVCVFVCELSSYLMEYIAQLLTLSQPYQMIKWLSSKNHNNIVSDKQRVELRHRLKYSATRKSKRYI